MHPEWENAKQRYHSIQPPEELSTGVEEAVRRFRLFGRCREQLCRGMDEGNTLLQMLAAV